MEDIKPNFLSLIFTNDIPGVKQALAEDLSLIDIHRGWQTPFGILRAEQTEMALVLLENLQEYQIKNQKLKFIHATEFDNLLNVKLSTVDQLVTFILLCSNNLVGSESYCKRVEDNYLKNGQEHDLVKVAQELNRLGFKWRHGLIGGACLAIEYFNRVDER